ncbi:hypothetical protein CJ030_MR8G005359 [Morella rubra]|uniref:Uncharacterized protein n=1 Tax=Morella rubra TaxID=262757 RepID=A0A6A1UQB1_9ROSI|nr:hypothetical protein CJ030_MR8G005359 [Morella rubra]
MNGCHFLQINDTNPTLAAGLVLKSKTEINGANKILIDGDKRIVLKVTFDEEKEDPV